MARIWPEWAAPACQPRLSLLPELERARVVSDAAVLENVARMGSMVEYETDTADGRTVTLVFPKDGSVLTPIGTALLGLSAGQTMGWTEPDADAVKEDHRARNPLRFRGARMAAQRKCQTRPDERSQRRSTTVGVGETCAVAANMYIARARGMESIDNVVGCEFRGSDARKSQWIFRSSACRHASEPLQRMPVMNFDHPTLHGESRLA
ncbi:hypothetical protein CN193_21705 [Sinorhizobium meliloti]|nr:hypothetical protein CN193_21705 [Sinorhizobium meliloti]